MRILIDIGHPAHVHLFKHFARNMAGRGNEIFFTSRDNEHEAELLRMEGFRFKHIGNKASGKLGKLLRMFLFTCRIYRIALVFKPQLFLSHGSMYAGFAAFLYRKPHIALEDSGNMEQVSLCKPFTRAFISPESLDLDLGEKHIKYNGNHELAYLAPAYFKPDPGILDILNVKPGEPYAILRFVSWSASHDIRQGGLSEKEKEELVAFLTGKYRVFISSEKKLPGTLSPYRISIPPDRMHDALAFAAMYIGEGATMASEAGVLGTPSFYISSIKRCYNEDQEKYGTVFNIGSFGDLLKKINEVTGNPGYKDEFMERRNKLLSEKVDLTSFLTWFVSEWPESFAVMKNDPGYQYTFKL